LVDCKRLIHRRGHVAWPGSGRTPAGKGFYFLEQTFLLTLGAHAQRGLLCTWFVSGTDWNME